MLSGLKYDLLRTNHTILDLCNLEQNLWRKPDLFKYVAAGQHRQYLGKKVFAKLMDLGNWL